MNNFNAKMIKEFRAKGGKDAHSSSGRLEFDGVPLILLHHIGAISGAERVNPVVCYPQLDGSLAVIASNGGAPRHPDWYNNLKAHPQVDVEFGPDIFKVAVRELGGSERDVVWTGALRMAPQLREIQERTFRQIPVLLLTRITEGS
jgi:deazaflavin-dependent oxidoreductase (nitroreductase family)